MADLITLSEQVERDQRKPLSWLRKKHRELEVLASAHSGEQGVLGLTPTHMVFAFQGKGMGAPVRFMVRDRAAIRAAQVDGSDLLVQDDEVMYRFKNVEPPERAQDVVERLTAGGAADAVLPQQQLGPARSALRILPAKTRQLVEQVLRPDENVHVVFVGAGGQAMIAADDRMLVAKKGFMAGATLGSKTLDFPYDQISGIEIHVGAMTGYMQIVSAAFQANLPGSYWSKDKKHDPWKLPNCIPVGRDAVTKFQPTLALVRERIARGYWTTGVGAPPPQEASAPVPALAPAAASDLATQIKDLAALHEAGALSDDEFAQAKRKLLG